MATIAKRRRRRAARLVWTVAVERGAPEPADTAVTDAAIVAFGEQLVPLAASVAGGPDWDHYGARVSIKAATALEAAQLAQEEVEIAAAAAGLPDWPIVRLYVTREDVFLDDISKPVVPPT